MSQTESTTVVTDEGSIAAQPAPQAGGGTPPAPPRVGGGGGGGGRFFQQFKPEQGKATRLGTFAGVGLLIAWGAKVLYNELTGIQGEEAWWVWVTSGVPLALAVVVGAVAWWFIFSNRAASDFMIATEGEMKKVCWSSKNEIIGSTKVVIGFTNLLVGTTAPFALG